MHPELSRDPLFVEWFTAEILTLASLRGDEDCGRRGNEAVVKIHNFGFARRCGLLVLPDGVNQGRVAGAVPDEERRPEREAGAATVHAAGRRAGAGARGA